MGLAPASNLSGSETDGGPRRRAAGLGAGASCGVGTDRSAGSAGGCGRAVCVGAVDVAGMSEGSLRARLSVIAGGESRLAAMKSQALAELNRVVDTLEAQRIATEELGSSKRDAKRDVETAARLEELPATSEALGSGEIPAGHAHLIARAAGEGDVSESELVEAATKQSFDEFAKTVRRHQQDQSPDDGQSLLDRQRKNRKARIFESPESGMFVLQGEFDRITGARIATALTARQRQLWHDEDPEARRTPQQRVADALADLICETGTGKPQGAELLVLADYDVINEQLTNARLTDGGPIPVDELRRLALEAKILPTIFDADSHNMWLGRARRSASEAQRKALIARDQHCIGCQANPLWCRAHHIVWWSHNGPTDLKNLLLVCDGCHRKIHQHGWQVHRHKSTKKFCLKPPPEHEHRLSSRRRGRKAPNTRPANMAPANASARSLQDEPREPDQRPSAGIHPRRTARGSPGGHPANPRIPAADSLQGA